MIKRSYYYIIMATAAVFLVFACVKEEKGPQVPLQITTLDSVQAKSLAMQIEQSVSVKLAEGLEMSLWASDSLLFDPVALNIDPLGRVYTTATNRGGNSEFDIRGHQDWMTESISFQSVEDRRNFLRRKFSPDSSEKNSWFPDLNKDSIHDWHDLAVEKERVFRMEDKNGDGLADFSQVFVEDFHEEITDVANGVLYHDGDVFVSVGPDVWRLRDTNGDGQADTKESISHGWAVHIGFGGHGMSGLTVGPDGKIWWGIGDIGMNVKDKSGKEWKYPNQGVIVRCNPDGSDFEVFAAGLRNTHEFVFDEYGNLITEDNDGDHPGEKERLMYLVEGSDSGWRINWQFGKYTDPSNNTYKVWMEEEMFKPRFEGQAAYILPPIMNYHSGPSGMKYNPGTALGEKWQNKFFIVEFNGNPSTSGIHAFDLQPKGAGFELKSEEKIMSGVLAVGIDFGPDGALYMNDWIDGWNVKNYGRVWKLDVPKEQADPRRIETKRLIQEDFSKKKETELAELLKYPDMRIRQKAQFTLAKRGSKGYKQLLAAAKQNEHRLARIHGLWGMGQLARKEARYTSVFEDFLNDGDPEIIAQAAKLIGDIRITASSDKLIPLLKHDNPRVRYFAAEGLGRTANAKALQPIMDLIVENNDEDVYFRHVGSLALARIGNVEALTRLSSHPSKALRTAAVVALRRMTHPNIANFLNDTDEFIVTEAARAINDEWSIEGALPALAQVLREPRFKNEALLRRAINANSRVGQTENITILKEFLLREDAPTEMRAEALAALSVWAKPSLTDRVDGHYRGAVSRDAKPVVTSLNEVMASLLGSKEAEVQQAAIQATGKLAMADYASTLGSISKSAKDGKVRIAALQALSEMAHSDLDKALEIALSDRDPQVRAAAIGILPRSNLPEEKSVRLFEKILRQGTVKERQSALASLGKFKGPEAKAVLNRMMDELMVGRIQAEIQLDVLEAAFESKDPILKEKIEKYESRKPKDDVLAQYRETLSGGDARRGQRIMISHAGAQCMRCHAIFEWGANVGPNLAEVGKKFPPKYLLESLVAPSSAIAAGYGIATLTLKDGKTLVGIVASETPTHINLRIGNADLQQIEKAQVAQRVNAPSSMPPMGGILSKREIRDLVAFLGELKGERP